MTRIVTTLIAIACGYFVLSRLEIGTVMPWVGGIAGVVLIGEACVRRWRARSPDGPG